MGKEIEREGHPRVRAIEREKEKGDTHTHREREGEREKERKREREMAKSERQKRKKSINEMNCIGKVWLQCELPAMRSVFPLLRSSVDGDAA